MWTWNVYRPNVTCPSVQKVHNPEYRSVKLLAGIITQKPHVIINPIIWARRSVGPAGENEVTSASWQLNEVCTGTHFPMRHRWTLRNLDVYWQAHNGTLLLSTSSIYLLSGVSLNGALTGSFDSSQERTPWHILLIRIKHSMIRTKPKDEMNYTISWWELPYMLLWTNQDSLSRGICFWCLLFRRHVSNFFNIMIKAKLSHA